MVHKQPENLCISGGRLWDLTALKIFPVFLLISQDFADLPEFHESATT